MNISQARVSKIENGDLSHTEPRIELAALIQLIKRRPDTLKHMEAIFILRLWNPLNDFTEASHRCPKWMLVVLIGLHWVLLD